MYYHNYGYRVLKRASFIILAESFRARFHTRRPLSPPFPNSRKHEIIFSVIPTFITAANDLFDLRARKRKKKETASVLRVATDTSDEFKKVELEDQNIEKGKDSLETFMEGIKEDMQVSL